MSLRVIWGTVCATYSAADRSGFESRVARVFLPRENLCRGSAITRTQNKLENPPYPLSRPQNWKIKSTQNKNRHLKHFIAHHMSIIASSKLKKNDTQSKTQGTLIIIDNNSILLCLPVGPKTCQRFHGQVVQTKRIYVTYISIVLRSLFHGLFLDVSLFR